MRERRKHTLESADWIVHVIVFWADTLGETQRKQELLLPSHQFQSVKWSWKVMLRVTWPVRLRGLKLPAVAFDRSSCSCMMSGFKSGQNSQCEIYTAVPDLDIKQKPRCSFSRNLNSCSRCFRRMFEDSLRLNHCKHASAPGFWAKKNPLFLFSLHFLPVLSAISGASPIHFTILASTPT